MKMFMIDQDMELCDIINKGAIIPMKKNSGDKDIPKSEYGYNQSDFEVVL